MKNCNVATGQRVAYGTWGRQDCGPIERVRVGDIDHRKGTLK